MESDDTIVEETPILNIDESDSGNDSEPSVVITQAQKAQSSKRKRNGDKEEEYEIYARTNSERASIWQHFDPVRIPFKFVEHEAFVEYTNACNGRFMLPSRHKLSRDDCYYRDLERMPEHSDFGVCEGVVEFLEKFKTKTELISSSSKPLAHLFYREILDIDKHLRYWATKPESCHMVDDMVKKYNRYWGKFDELNDYMYFATLLDPTMKQQLVSHGFKKMLEYNMSSESPLSDDALNAMVREMLKEVVNRMGVLFQTYKTRFDTVVSKSSSKKTKDQQSCKSYVGENDFLDDFLNLEDSGSIEMDTELTRDVAQLGSAPLHELVQSMPQR
ncbi:zinc finger BED domain-containing protein RICESLEEPER 1 [Artemisia annua]|uniref:Zinc finger BED domain-containing protein RICESLEEPER 1 n=1 Tax=Artemisia annua TaxID=35608 RepID=A0A2U1KU98_ARTAN|nr:zinc finger BED domain-containing protein RICESLEEPER 1 [Artemisia annua]